jgi:hypothetical protein
MKGKLPKIEIFHQNDDTIRVNAGELANFNGTITFYPPKNQAPAVWSDGSYAIRFDPDFDWKFGVDGEGRVIAVAVKKQQEPKSV